MQTPENTADLSPMMKQYLDIKQKHKDQILFFRLGDFYEMFFDDAVTASRELELTLTGRDCGLGERAPMCGVPHHSAESYIARLIKKGYKVAICEQLENPATAKGMVKRDIIRVVTPGTLIESGMLDEGANNYLCTVYACSEGYGVVFADISTGEMQTTQLGPDDDALCGELGRFAPNEVRCNEALLDRPAVVSFLRERLPAAAADVAPPEAFDPEAAQLSVLRQFKALTLEKLNLNDSPLAVRALGATLAYLQETQRVGMERIQTVTLYNRSQYMRLDVSARRNLELTETLRTGDKRGSLFWVLDKTRTSMGRRRLRSAIEQPLLSPAAINRRLNAVTELTRNSILVAQLQGELGGVYDMERLMTRVVYGSASPKDMIAIGSTVQNLPEIKRLLSDVQCEELREIESGIDPLPDIGELVEKAIDPDSPDQLKDGGVIRAGYDAHLDELRHLSKDTKDVIASIEAAEREKTGIKNLRIGYNKVFGYYIEVTASNLGQVPPEYIRKQTLVGSERYITQELKELETRVMNAQTEIIELVAQLFEQVRQTVAAELPRIQRTAEAVGRLDMLASFAAAALADNYVCPEVDCSGEILIRDGRHPVVEQTLVGAPFVPNDLRLNNAEDQIALITGPNMAGKSTYMRQNALIVLMAQIGSFVPASYAHIGIVDGIYTRVGASDDLAMGQSTFMVEMSEVAAILREATSRSLLILDEIGRGTSTFDGMSIARAVVEYIADKKKLGAKTLFSTHYHELTELEKTIPCLKNYNVAVKKRGEDIIFLRRILPGGVDESYGVEVAKLAGIPPWIVRRAYAVLDALEHQREVSDAPISTAARAREELPEQTVLSDRRNELLVRRLSGVDVDTLSPLEALNLLYELKTLAGNGEAVSS